MANLLTPPRKQVALLRTALNHILLERAEQKLNTQFYIARISGQRRYNASNMQGQQEDTL